MLCFGMMSYGQWHEPKRVTQKFFPDPDVEIDVPAFRKNSGYTSYKEMTRFIEDLVDKYPELLHNEIVGETQKGRSIPLVTVRKGDDVNKIRLFYFARIHGDEPAGTESLLFLIKQLVEKPELQYLLDKVSFYIMPMVNVDGAQAFGRYTANRIDLNRDQSKLQTPEAKMLHQVVNRIVPHVSVDFHEYQPVRADFRKLSSDVLATPWDVMFLYSGNPNVPQVLRDAVDNIFIPAAEEILDRHQLTHHPYYSSTSSLGQVSLPVGGTSPRSTSNAMALKNTISLLMETRGIKLGATSLKRRTWAGYLLAETFAKTAYERESEIRSIIAKSIADETDIAVRFTAKTVSDVPLSFIDLTKNELVSIPVDMRLSAESKPTLVRPLPEAYYILPQAHEAVDVLRQMGVEVSELTHSETVEVEAFGVRTYRESASPVGGVYPVNVTTEQTIKRVEFPAGSFRVDMKQRNKRVATVLLEPESANGFVNYRVVDVNLGEEMPMYRKLKTKSINRKH